MVIEAIQVIQDLAIVMIVALPMALLSHFLKQPLVIGYILAGIIVGPYTPPFGFLAHPEILNLFAEIGIVFLLFAIGLEFPLARLRRVGRKAIVIAISEALGTFALGVLAAEALGFGRFDSLFLGLAVSVTSTVILSRVLEDLGVLQTPDASLILGVAIIEDVVVVSALATIQSFAITGQLALLGIGTTLLLVALFIAATLLIGPRVIPRLVDAVAETQRPDLLLIATLGVAFGFSILSSVIGISVATGAFLAGVLVAESKNQARANQLVAPLKSLFGAIFFVSMGALMDIGILPRYLLPVTVLILVAYGAKSMLVYFASRSQALSSATSRRASLSLAPSGGELAFVVAKGGTDVGVTSAFLLPVIGAVTIVTAFLSPFVVRLGWRPPPGAVPPAGPSKFDAPPSPEPLPT
jgi:CPA2 family monovalent cation:H+ antiporter-2